MRGRSKKFRLDAGRRQLYSLILLTHAYHTVLVCLASAVCVLKGPSLFTKPGTERTWPVQECRYSSEHENKDDLYVSYSGVSGIYLVTPSSPRSIRGRALAQTPSVEKRHTKPMKNK
jgi:hypothetical protein